MGRQRPHPGLVSQHEAAQRLRVSARQFRRWGRREGMQPRYTRYGSAQEHLYDWGEVLAQWEETHPGWRPAAGGAVSAEDLEDARGPGEAGQPDLRELLADAGAAMVAVLRAWHARRPTDR